MQLEQKGQDSLQDSSKEQPEKRQLRSLKSHQPILQLVRNKSRAERLLHALQPKDQEEIVIRSNSRKRKQLEKVVHKETTSPSKKSRIKKVEAEKAVVDKYQQDDENRSFNV